MKSWVDRMQDRDRTEDDRLIMQLVISLSMCGGWQKYTLEEIIRINQENADYAFGEE